VFEVVCRKLNISHIKNIIIIVLVATHIVYITPQKSKNTYITIEKQKHK
jgi:hypothetical protein